VRDLVEYAILFPLNILIVPDEVALHACMLLESALHQQRHFARINWLGKLRSLQIAFLILPMQLKPLAQRNFQAVQIEVGIGGFRVTPSIPHVDLLVRVHDEVVHCIIPIAIEQCNVDVVHPGDAHAHVLIQLLSERRIWR
jgi:hypothetical protein